MTNQLSKVMISLLHGQLKPQAPLHSTPDAATVSDKHMRDAFQQLVQSLTALNTSPTIIYDRHELYPEQTLQDWLAPNVRQAEAAVNRLRDLGLTSEPSGTELIQCMTVLVLAADMLIQQRLSGAAVVEGYELISRSAERALNAMNDLQKLFPL